ncbi:MAG: HAD family phosphatase [Bacteroidetes bacterium]|nr:MAG: HAD family phosphatase [Bacteroidota bacterium]
MPAPYLALLFDMDGVLIDSEPLHEQAKRVVFERYGLDVPEDFYDEVKGKTDQHVFELVMARYGRNGLDLATLIADKHAAYEALLPSLRMVPGALAFLQEARRQYRTALTTSATRRNQELAFARFSLHACFEVVVTAADVSRPKPEPDPYLVTAERLGLPPARCLVIEDAVNGVLSARAAGCDVAGLTTSFAAAPLREAGATVVVDSYEALRAWLAEQAAR